MITRKQFLTAAAVTYAAATTSLWSRADEQAAPSADVIVTIDPQHKGHTVSQSLTGLSYETSQLANPDFFSPTNRDLISYFRLLSHNGVLRLGGNSVELADWMPASAPAATVAQPSQTSAHKHKRTGITRQAIDNLAGFLSETGWSLIYGLNLGTGTADAAADQAKYVAKAAGKKLIAFQIGNEPDLYSRNGLRAAYWSFEDYFAEWTTFADAVQQESPNAPMAGPDIASRQDWITQFAEAASDRVVLLTGHYYAEGPPSSPRATCRALLLPSQKLDRFIAAETNAMRTSGLPYRMAESNSCFNGGKAGVSDTFASALWGANYMLQLAQAGQTGVDFHGGAGNYTPIANSLTGGYMARPLFYGMLLAQQFAGTDLLKATVQAPGLNVTAYASRSKREQLVALFNRDTLDAHTFQVSTGAQQTSAKLWSLTAMELDSQIGVSLAGSEVSSNASWTPTATELDTNVPGQFVLTLPAGSAALLFI